MAFGILGGALNSWKIAHIYAGRAFERLELGAAQACAQPTTIVEFFGIKKYLP